MNNPIQKASKEASKQHETQDTSASIVETDTNQKSKNTPTPVVNTSPEYERQNLKDLVSLQLKELLFKEVLKNNLENGTKIKGKISINFLNNRQNPKSIPVRDITLQTLTYTIDKVTNLILANKNYNAYILPFVSDNGGAEQCNVMGGESLIIDLDEGNTDEKLKLITQTFGTPSIILKSGSIVNGEYPCRHIYYKFDEYLSGDRFKKLLDIRGKIAKGFGGDVAYARNSAQLVRIFGSFNHKEGTKRVSKIEQNNLATAIYSFDDFCLNADKYFAENPIVEKNIQQQLPLTANSSNKEESVETLEFPIHQPPLELNDGQVIDYLNALVPDIFAKGNYELWLKALFATFHQYKGSEKGRHIFQEFSLKDNSRPEKEILDSINQHWKYSKCEKTNQKVTTFRTIIDIVNNKDFVANEIQKNPHLGEVIRIFSDNLLYDETYVLTENFLCIKVKPKGKNAPPPYLLPICNHLEVLGGGNGSKGTSYRLIRYIDTNGKLVENLLAISLKGQELQTYLTEINLQFNTKYYSLIHNYMLNSENSSKQINIIHKLGWNEDQTCYSLAYKNGIKSYFVDKQANNKKVYLEFGASPDEYLRTKGNLENLKELSRLSIGNDNMILALGVAYAAMWLKPLDEAGRVIHFWGQSQKGKSSLLSVTSSVYGITIGNEDYHDWSTTLNGLENLCKIRNDCPLPMDEAQKVKYNNTLSEAPYMVCGGSGSTRMAYNQTSNNNRVTTTWRTLLVSTGEKSYPDIMAERNLSQNIKAGMMNRWCDYPVVTEKFGVFTTLHEFADKFEDENIAAEEFRKYVVSLARKNKGQAISAYLEYVFEIKGFDDSFIEIKSLFESWLAKYFYNNPKITAKNSSQEISIAKMFGITAAALKLAVDAGIYDFEQEYIFEVLARCYNKFLANKVDVHMSAEDRLLKKALINFLNTELHKGFYENGPYSNVPVNMYGIKEQLSFCANEISKYDYYVEVGKWDIIFKGQTPALVKRFLRNNEFIAINPTKSDSKKTEYSFNKHNRLIGRSANYNKLDLIKIGFLLPDGEDDPEPPTNNPPTDKLTSSNTIVPDIKTTAVNEITAVAPSLILPRNNLLSLLNSLDSNTLYSIGVTMRSIEPNLGILTDYEPLTLHIFELIKNKMWVIDIRNEPFSQEEQEAFMKLKLVCCSFNALIKVLPKTLLQNVESLLIAQNCAEDSEESETSRTFVSDIFGKNFASLEHVEEKLDVIKLHLEHTQHEWYLASGFDIPKYVYHKDLALTTDLDEYQKKIDDLDEDTSLYMWGRDCEKDEINF